MKEPAKIVKTPVGENLMDDVVFICFDIQPGNVCRPQDVLEIFRRVSHIAQVYQLALSLSKG